MRSYSHLMEQYLTHENYMLGVKNATRHKGGKKRKYRKAKYYRDHAEELEPKMLEYAERFHNAEHTPKQIYDGLRRKQRTIIVPSMKEQVVHHMIINVLKPIFMFGMYEHSYGSIPGRGGHMAKKRIESWIHKKDKNMKYCLKMDVKKYFDSIPHEILKSKLAEIIHDKRFLLILYEIVNAVPGGYGIPLGFYTSQWFANWYLTGLDHFIKEDLKAKYYVRYMDDMVIFGANKRELHRIREEISEYLQTRLGLEMKENWQVFRFDYVREDGTHIGRDLDFMGFRFFRDKTILRKTIMYRATRKANRINRKATGKTIIDCRQMLSYLGWIDCTQTYGMYKKYIKPKVSFRSMRRYVGRYQKAENMRQMNSKDISNENTGGKNQCGTNRKMVI